MSVRSRALRALAACAVVAATAIGPAASVAGAAQAAEPAPTAPTASDAPHTQGSGSARDARDADGTLSRAARRAAREAADDDSPLKVTIDDLTPGALPATGPLVVRGTITNTDLETWRDLNLYPLFNVGAGCGGCAAVMTTDAELGLAVDTDPATPIGQRYTDDERVRAQVPSLEPGQSASYTITVPQRVLRQLFRGARPGVYWFGVHALGSSDSSPRGQGGAVADGRARTFLPYLPAGAPVVDTALVLPLRARIERNGDGALADPTDWQRAMSLSGRLGGPLAFGAAADGRPLTWLVDPAVPDAVAQLAQGNPDRDLTSATGAVDPASDPSASPGASPSASEPTTPSPSPSAGDQPSGDGSGDSTDPATREAAAWLQQARTELARGEVAALPYGDPDLAAVADHSGSSSGLYATARRLTSPVLTSWGLATSPVTTGPDGYLDLAAIDSLDDDAPLLLGDELFGTETFSSAPPADGLIGNHPVVVASQGAADGGPGTEPLSATGLRQRILSEAVVRSLAASRDGATRPDPLVVVLPTPLDVGGARSFWSGLSTPWVRLSGLDALSTPAGDPTRPDGARRIDPTDLSFTKRREDDELSGAVVSEAVGAVRSARVLQRLLGESSGIGDALVGDALAGLSVAQRGNDGAGERLGRIRAWAEERLGQVEIVAPDGVTLSSSSGSFNVALRNRLSRPVTVSVVASTDTNAAVEIENPITIAADSSVSVPVDAQTSRAGVHNVVLRLADSEGDPVGATATTAVRSGQVGVVIWVIMGTGAAILFSAIAMRLLRRIRGRRSGGAAAGSAG